jgi:hypothetical protein
MAKRHTIAIGDGKCIGYCLVAVEYALMNPKERDYDGHEMMSSRMVENESRYIDCVRLVI